MTGGTAASLINLLGFITGLVLYVMLLSMVLTSRPGSNSLTLLTGILGFAWNAGAFGGYGLANLGFMASPLLLAGAFGALCFLPAVVVHSALRAGEKITGLQNLLIAGLAYGMSGIATIMHFYSAITRGTAPSKLALRAVTVGFAALLIVLLVLTRGQQGRGRVLWVVAMSVFAVSALHLSNPDFGQDPWWLQLAGHHASLPLALLILYQDFRFAFADIFLKRALSFIFLAGLIFGIFAFGVMRILVSNPTSDRSIALLLAMWAFTALTYPFLRRVAESLVDKVVLRRVDYSQLAVTLSGAIDRCELPNAILDETVRILSPALSAQSIAWSESESEGHASLVKQDRRSAQIAITSMDGPYYMLYVRDLSGGRRLLSDDVAMLERVALLVARRIDAVRSMQERYRHDLQEQEMRKLAAEAELRALRAQINPHFLFNTLNVLANLIHSNPEKAERVTEELAGIFRYALESTRVEWVTLNDELEFLESYLAIEKTRFEERLSYSFDVDTETRSLKIPPMILQPLVENAIKHGIAPEVSGGSIKISGRAMFDYFVIEVEDTGRGRRNGSRRQSSSGTGIGLKNVRERLLQVYGEAATLKLVDISSGGTRATLILPQPVGVHS